MLYKPTRNFRFILLWQLTFGEGKVSVLLEHIQQPYELRTVNNWARSAVAVPFHDVLSRSNFENDPIRSMLPGELTYKPLTEDKSVLKLASAVGWSSIRYVTLLSSPWSWGQGRTDCHSIVTGLRRRAPMFKVREFLKKGHMWRKRHKSHQNRPLFRSVVVSHAQ